MLILNNLNESTFDVGSVDAMVVPAYLNENFTGIAELGNYNAEVVFEAVIEAEANLAAMLQRGASAGRLNEAYETALNEGAVGNFFTKVKELFKKLVAAVKALFTKFVAWLDSKFKSDKDFVAKYKKTILNKKISDFSYKGYEWAIEKASIEGLWGWAESFIQTKLAQATAKVEKGSDKGWEIENLRDAAMKAAGSKLGINEDTAEEIKKEYATVLRGGDTEKSEIDKVNVQNLMSVVEGFEKDKAAVEKADKAATKAYDVAIKEMEKMERAKDTPAQSIPALSNTITICREVATLSNSLSGIYVTALKDRRSEYRGVLAAIVGYKGE